MSRIRELNVFGYILLIYVIVVLGTENETENVRTLVAANRTNDYEERFRILEKLLKLAFEKKYSDRETTNEVDALPTDTLSGIYTECLFGLSFSCLQKKLISFLYELDKVKRIDLVGTTVMIVRKREVPSDTTILAKIADHVDQTYLKEIIDNLVDKFFENHFLRVRIPEYFEDVVDKDGDGTYVDIDFQNKESSSIREGRKKKGGKLKGLKKIMMIVGLMTCAKLTMMGPLMMGLLGLKAMKALMMAVAALTISKMMMLSKVNLSSLMGGGGGHEAISFGGHGGGGWDRNIQEVPPSPPTSALPYYIEPPSTFNSHKVYTQYQQ